MNWNIMIMLENMALKFVVEFFNSTLRLISSDDA